MVILYYTKSLRNLCKICQGRGIWLAVVSAAPRDVYRIALAGPLAGKIMLCLNSTDAVNKQTLIFARRKHNTEHSL